MSNFKVGDRVRCVDAEMGAPESFYNPLVKGREYIVTNVKTCPNCNSVELQVGVITKESYRAWCGCRAYEIVYTGQDAPFSGRRFEKSLKKPNTSRLLSMLRLKNLF
jgi:hypothetical protein